MTLAVSRLPDGRFGDMPTSAEEQLMGELARLDKLISMYEVENGLTLDEAELITLNSLRARRDRVAEQLGYATEYRRVPIPGIQTLEVDERRFLLAVAAAAGLALVVWISRR